MARNVAGSWQKAVQLLQDCNTRQTASTEAQAAVRSVKGLIGQLQGHPTPPKAVWKKLVQQMQVCCVLLLRLRLLLGLHVRSYLP